MKHRTKTWPKVSVVIVNWNGLDWLKVCLPSLAKVTYPNLEVVVVDNGSNDGSLEYLEKSVIVTTVVRNATNLGFPYPNNQGIEQSTGEFILCLNNDMRYDPGFIEPLVEACRQPGVGAVQPKMVLLKKPTHLDGVGSYLTKYGILLHFGFGRAEDAPAYNVERDIFCPKGAAMMVRRDVLEQTVLTPGREHLRSGSAKGDYSSEVKETERRAPDYFDGDYFAYFEETDLAWRIWLAGYRIRYVPSSLVWHVGAETAKRISTFAHYHSFKNRLATLIKNLGLGTLLWMLPLHLSLIGLVSLAYLVTGQLHLVTGNWRAVWWNVTNLKATLTKRWHVQRVIRTVSDRALLPKIMRPLPFNYFRYLFGANLEDWPEPTWLTQLSDRG